MLPAPPRTYLLLLLCPLCQPLRLQLSRQVGQLLLSLSQLALSVGPLSPSLLLTLGLDLGRMGVHGGRV